MTPSDKDEIPSKDHRHSTRWQFIIGWFVMFALHGLCLGYFVGVAILYRAFLPGPGAVFRYQLRTYSIGISETEYPNVALVHEIIAAIHAFFMLLMLGGSLRARKLVFYPDWQPIWQRTRLAGMALTHKLSQHYSQPNSGTRTSSDASMGRYISGRISSAISLLGVDSVYFDHIMLVRELVETSLQTYQAYRMSHLLPRLWLTRIFVLLLVANCWIVPIVHRVYKKTHRVRRLMSLVFDIVLDLMSSMGISFYIFATYVPEYNDPYFGFPLKNFYIDEWFISLYQQFQMMVVMSWSDMASRLVFAFGVLLGMDSIKDLLIDASDEKPSKEPKSIRDAAVIAPERIKLSSSQLVAKRIEVPDSGSHKVVQFILHVVGPVGFVMWGIIILGIHMYAEVHYVNLPCKLPLRPWLTTKPACSLVEIDCYQISASGSVDSLDKDWTVFEPSLAAGIVIRHCPDLTMPATIQSFTGLITFKMYNATISSWPEMAGLMSTQASLRAIYIVRTNFTNGDLPPGLVRHDFPSSVSTFVSSATNLVSLPDSLDTVWPKYMSIVMEFASFTSIPDVILRLHPSLISFAYTPITSLPARLFETSGLRILSVLYTPLQELPRDVTKLTPGFESLAVDGTNISVFWSWIEPMIAGANALHRRTLLAANTPYCRERDEIVKGTRHQFSAVATETNLASIMDGSTPSRLEYSLATLECMPHAQMVFPLAVEDATSQIRG